MKEKNNCSLLRKKFLLFVILLNFTFFLSFVSSANIGISPAKINFENVLRSGYAQRTIVVSVDSVEPVNVELQARGEIGSWINYSAQNFSVSKNNPYYLTVFVSPPEDVANGNYSGMLRFLTSNFGDNLEDHAVSLIRSSLDLSINTQVTDIEDISCDVKGFSVLSAEEGEDVVVKVNVLNTGNVRLKPTVLLDIWDSDQIEVLKSEEFIGEEIFPTLSNEFVFRIDSDDLDLGQYWSEFTVLECVDSGLLTFDILEEGALSVSGELLNILTPDKMNVKDTTSIIVNFKNTGEKEVEAQFKGKVTLAGKIVQILEGEKLLVGVDDVETFNFYFTPQKAGKYIVSGRVFYNGKKTFELSSAFEAISNKGLVNSLFLPFVYVFFIAVISILFYKIRKERMIYLSKLRGINLK